jgi:hypothetical protein
LKGFIIEYVWKCDKLLMLGNGTFTRNPKFDGRMFAKMQVTDSVEQNKIRLNCYKYITKGMNQKRANVKYVVYKKYLSK